MSRTYRHRNKDNTKNRYLKKHLAGSNSFHSRDRDADLQRLSAMYFRGEERFNAPRWFRNVIQKKRRGAERQALHQGIVTEKWEELTFDPQKRNAGYFYF